jgi:hypothetical protein
MVLLRKTIPQCTTYKLPLNLALGNIAFSGREKRSLVMTQESQKTDAGATSPPGPAEGEPSSDLVSRIEKLEATVVLTKKTSAITAAVAVLMGSGGLLGYVQYFSEAPGKQQLSAVELLSKETSTLISVADKLESRGDKAQADALVRKAASLSISYLSSKPNYAPVPVDAIAQTTDIAAQSKEEELKGLPNTAVRVAIASIVNGQPVGTASNFFIKGRAYQITIDYLNFRLEPLANVTKEPDANRDHARLASQSGFAVVGVGLRITLNVLARSDFPFIPQLHALGLAADRGDLDGTWTVQTLGITGKSVAAALPLPDKLSLSSMTRVDASVQSVKGLLSAPDTKIAPRIVAYQMVDEGYSWKPIDPIPASSSQPLRN